MAQIALMRTIHPLPGKEQDVLAYLRETEPIRHQWGLAQQLVLRRPLLSSEPIVVLFVWEDEAAYRRWLESDDRQRLNEQGQHLRVQEPDERYEVV